MVDTSDLDAEYDAVAALTQQWEAMSEEEKKKALAEGLDIYSSDAAAIDARLGADPDATGRGHRPGSRD